MNNSKIDPASLFLITSGLYVVTSHHGIKVNGLISNSVLQVTADPTYIAVSIHRDNLTHEYIKKSKSFAFNILDESTPMSLIKHFGFQSGRKEDKFKSFPYTKEVTGSPLIQEHCLSQVEVQVEWMQDVKTHTIFIGKMVYGKVLHGGKPLSYDYYHEVKKGTSPEKAPTYRGTWEIQTLPVEKAMDLFHCDVCGYVYNPQKGDPAQKIPAGTSFEDLPETWRCPVCGAQHTAFRKVKHS